MSADFQTIPEGWDVSSLSAPSREPSGGLLQAVEAVAQELQKSRSSQQELGRAHELFLGVLEGTTDAVFVKDLGGRCLMLNRAAARMVNRPAHEALGQDDFALFPTEQAQRLRRADRRIMTLAAPRTFEETLTTGPEQKPRHYLITEGPCRDGSGRIAGVFSIARDITERKDAELQRSLLVRELEESVQARDDFLATASHELKTPLAALRLNLENTRRQWSRKPASDDSHAWMTGRLEQAERQVQHLAQQVANLLDVTRMASGRLELELAQVDLVPLVAEVVQRFREELDSSGTQLTTHGPESFVARVDRLRMEQVVTNLISNALKYGSQGQVSVKLDRFRGLSRLSVRDQGPGIPAEFRSRIFERFERGAPGGNIPGSGLGLWIVREIVEAHGGFVRVHSRAGRGSCFTVLL